MTPGEHRPQLRAEYTRGVYEPFSHTDLLHDEIQQRRETGYDVDGFVREANELDPHDRAAVLALLDRIEDATRSSGWTYVEPDDLAGIAGQTTAPERRAPARAELGDRILAGWLGRIAGCNLGKPVEWGWTWSAARIREYLELADAYPLRDYIPALDPMPEGFAFNDTWTESTRGRVHGSARDDDIDYAILALHLLEQHGDALTTAQVGAAWLRLFPIDQVYTAEKAVYINLVNGHDPAMAARHRNPYREWIGAQIRGDVFGYIHPGDPATAARRSFADAALSHLGNGIYGEMWVAALVAAAFVSADAAEALRIAREVVPRRSRLREALELVERLHADGRGADEALAEIQARLGHYPWVHTVNNAALVARALLWADGDVMSALSLAVTGGWDTDSNGATVGSVMGVLHGTARLPAQLVEPLEDRVHSALFGFDNVAISGLAERTLRLALERLG